jgi:ABC-type lipoprotein export system ATPase subunit
MIYNIKNLSCSYSASVRPVLEIEQLQIENGERVFFIGPSGVGKSTILESLGLMNNTIQENSNSVFDFLGESFIDIWDKGEAELKKKRNENFSFIFQSNNLFGSMTGYQNIISGAIINGEHEISSLKRKAAIIVGELLSDLNIKSGEDFNIFEMSGGQKQRVAFARAIIANKDILFADEPTGNLDWYNAEKLMMYLDVKLGSDKTAIIVTHDIELALKFATKIVLIDKKCELINGEENYYGIINANSIYSKKDNTWTNASEDKTLEKVRSEIRSKLIHKKI